MGVEIIRINIIRRKFCYFIWEGSKDFDLGNLFIYLESVIKGVGFGVKVRNMV